jgi:hypothetical protein
MTTSRSRYAASSTSATTTGASPSTTPATETYTDAVLRTGDYAGNPTAAFDTAAITHLAEYQQ